MIKGTKHLEDFRESFNFIKKLEVYEQNKNVSNKRTEAMEVVIQRQKAIFSSKLSLNITRFVKEERKETLGI